MALNPRYEKQINDIFAKHDVLRLIGQGAPSDEYSFEIPRIVEFLDRGHNAEELA
jgi:hypothetical protein